jgi:RNA exonuclease 1
LYRYTKGMFAKANGTCGVDHVGDVKAVHGKFLGPETALDKARTTSAYVEFENVDAVGLCTSSGIQSTHS